MTTPEVKIRKKKQKSQAPMRLKKVDLDYSNKQILTILGRQIAKLMELSYKGLLDKDSLSNLSLCHKLLADFKKQEEEELDNLTDEELEKLT